MKKNYYFIISFFFAAISMMSLSSCEDEEIANTLEGTWEGQMYVEHEWNGSWYETDYSEVTFLRDPYRYSSGDGYWVDYFKTRTPWRHDYYANHIRWNVKNGVINIYLIEDDIELNIRNYRLNDSRFSGEVYGSDGSWYEFSLRHVASPVRYDDYYWGFDYYDYYYAKDCNIINDETITRSAVPEKVTHSRRIKAK